MKVQVIVKTAEKVVATVKATVSPTHKVANLIEYAAENAGIVAFPDRELLLGGTALSVREVLSECGIEDGDVLELQFQASEQMVSKQLHDLLGTKQMTREELSMMYSYQHGMSLQDAFNVLGYSKEQSSAFFDDHKQFAVQGGQIKAVSILKTSPQSEAPPQIDPNSTLEVTVQVEVKSSVGAKPGLFDDSEEDESLVVCLKLLQTVAQAKKVIQEVAQVSFPDVELNLGGVKLQNATTLADAGISTGCNLTMIVHASEDALASQLEDLVAERIALSPNELALHFCQRHGAPVSQALRSLGLHSNLRHFLESRPQFCVNGGCISLVNGPEIVVPGLNHLSSIAEVPEALMAGIMCN